MKPDRTILMTFLIMLVIVSVAFGGSIATIFSYTFNEFLFVNGTNNMNATLNMSWNNISNLVMSTAPSDAVNLSFVLDHAGGGSSDAWNDTYYLRDTSRSLTGANVRRDVNNDLLYLWGGDTGNPQGGQIQLYGGANPGLDGGMAFAVGDAAGNFNPVMWIEGTTDTPHLTMISHQIKELLDPTAAQDAATKHYVDDAVAGGTSAQLNDYFKNDTSKLLYGSDLKRDVDNSYLAMYGGNAIAGGTGIIVAYGKNHPGTNEAEIIVGDAAGTGNIVVSGWRGGAAPLLDMNSYNITGIKTITNATDAVNKSYTDSLVANVSAGGSGGQIIYFNHSASPDVAGFETLNLIPSGNAEADESVVVNSGLGEVIVDPYVTSLLYPAITSIPPGLWRFRTFHYVSNSGGNTNAVFKVYKRSAGGVETLLFTAVSEDINANTVQEYLTSYAQASAISLLTTDRLEIKVYGQSTSVSDKTFHFVYDGSIHTSHVLTPISVLSSLDNYAYLPGRSGGQVLTGGTDANDNLILNGTSSATKTSSYVILQPDGGIVGVGTSTPSGKVDVAGTIRSTGSTNPTSGAGTEMRFTSSTGYIMAYNRASASYHAMRLLGSSIGIYIGGVAGKGIYIGTDGNVSIGSIYVNSSQFNVADTVRFANYGVGAATFDSGGNITSVSDAKYKTNILPYIGGLKEALQFIPKTYNWNAASGLATQDKNIGFVAQDIQAVLPDAVFSKKDVAYEQVLTKPEVKDAKSGEVTEEAEYTTVEKPVLNKDGSQSVTLSYSQQAVLATAINAIKELNAKIEAQNATINKQEERIAALEKKVGL